MRIFIAFPLAIALALFPLAHGFAQDSSMEHLAPMAKSADPAYEVAVIKPSDPSDTSQGFHMNGHHTNIENMPVTNLLMFAYSINKNQIVNAPAWFDSEHYDIDGVPDVEGVPSMHQYQRMVEKLLNDRFGLKVHHEMHELPIYALTVAKGGAKLTPSKSAPDAPIDQTGNGGAQRTMRFTNNNMGDFALDLQFELGRPVIDHTGLPGRYDFTLQWTNDEMRATSPNALPGFFTAIQEEIGLKLDATKGQVDVFVIDHAEKPSAN